MAVEDLENIVEWLENDEGTSRPYRAMRLRQLLEIFDSAKGDVLFFGGSSSYQAYMELRYAFIHGLYFATVQLTLTCIEKELAGMLYARGYDKAATCSLELLLSVSLEGGEIAQTLYDRINQLRKIRNSYTHFRALTHSTSSIQRSIEENIPLDDLSEKDAIESLHILAWFIDHAR